ncbi:MAG TPA: glycosyltransferase family 4 protein [Rhodocyclaceae bacterium]|nr:glycosyltransferase family 4 protein [Rhodocyclaceae bacterium]
MNSKYTIKVVLFSPSLDAVSGVSTHANMLFGSDLARQFELLHFQVGSEGRNEGKLRKLMRFVLSPLQLAGFLAKNQPQIVHINTSMDRKAFWRDIVYLIVARLMGCRVVNEFHSGFGPRHLFRNSLPLWLLRRFLLASHCVAVLSNETLRLHKEFDSRIRVVLVPNAIDAVSLLDAPRQINRDDPLRLVFVGRLVRTKGLFEMIEALALLKAERIPFCFKIAGSGADEAALRSLIAEYGLEQEVVLLGPLFGEAKNKLWLDSDVLVFPSHFEGLPYSILEAMAAGCVPVATAVGGIPDVMRDGEHGLFVALRDPVSVAGAIRRLAQDREELQRISQAGRSRIADQYTADRLAERFGQIYQSIL